MERIEWVICMDNVAAELKKLIQIKTEQNMSDEFETELDDLREIYEKLSEHHKDDMNNQLYSLINGMKSLCAAYDKYSDVAKKLYALDMKMKMDDDNDE